MLQTEILALIRHHAEALGNTYTLQTGTEAREFALKVDATCERMKALAAQLFQLSKSAPER